MKPESNLNVYLVGGAVRDTLLGLPVKDQDWVVVGSTANEMLNLGFRPVGKDFPVFLHPKTHEEYALARTERKSGKGYKGFKINADPSVTLENDLKRRDLTINAMAMDTNGNLIDPYGGAQDLKNKVLRHVSEAFSEDPLRVLRLARFAARYAPLNFMIAQETLTLAKQIVKDGECQHLTAERVWQEFDSALREDRPDSFIKTLKEIDALKDVLPEVDCLFGVPQPERHHPEIDTGLHTLMVLEQAALKSKNPATRFAALLHDVGKGMTDPKMWPKHQKHEALGGSIVVEICQRLRVPATYKKLAKLVAQHHLLCHDCMNLKPKTIFKLLKSCDAFRAPERFEQFLIACEADSTGRLGFEDKAYPQAAFLLNALDKAQDVDVHSLIKQGLTGRNLADELDKIRVGQIAACMSAFKNPPAAPYPS